jgi:hypothetical protein
MVLAAHMWCALHYWVFCTVPYLHISTCIYVWVFFSAIWKVNGFRISQNLLSLWTSCLCSWGIEGWFCCLCVLLLVLGMLSLVCDFYIVSSALTIASCSAWLLEHLLCDIDLNWCTKLLWIRIAIPALTPCSLLLPSVNICIACSSCSSAILTEFTGWSQSFGCTSWSISWTTKYSQKTGIYTHMCVCVWIYVYIHIYKGGLISFAST